jgi:hypothetical protein
MTPSFYFGDYDGSIVHGRRTETLQLLRTLFSLLIPKQWCPDDSHGLAGLKRTLLAWMNRHMQRFGPPVADLTFSMRDG